MGFIINRRPHNFGDTLSDDNENWKDAVFSQYPRPSVHPQSNTDLPDLKDIKIMGYTMRTLHHRYTEWVAFNPATFQADFNSVSSCFKNTFVYLMWEP